MAKQIPTGMTPLVCIPTTAYIRLSVRSQLAVNFAQLSRYIPRIAILLLLMVRRMMKDHLITLLV